MYGAAPDALSFTNIVSASVTDIGPLATTLTRLSPGVTYYITAVLETNEANPQRAESGILCAAGSAGRAAGPAA